MNHETPQSYVRPEAVLCEAAAVLKSPSASKEARALALSRAWESLMAIVEAEEGETWNHE